MAALVIIFAVLGAVLVIGGALLAYFYGMRPIKGEPGLYSIPRFGGLGAAIAILGALVGLAATIVGLNL